MASSAYISAWNTINRCSSHIRLVVKGLVILLLVINVKSWPLMWHIRVLRPFFRLRMEYSLLLCRTALSSRRTRDKQIDDWFDSRLPIGEGPFDKVSVYKTRSTIDDSDFRGHLSNSSYAKALDSARSYLTSDLFLMFFGCGGWLALGGAHFLYLQQIPRMAQYEVRSSIACWNQKWIFFVHKFVSKSQGKRLEPSKSKTPQSNSPDQNGHYTFLPNRVEAPSVLSTSSQDISIASKIVAARLTSTEEPEGTIVHAVAVSEACFKIGRITVPPALVCALNGLSAPSSDLGSSLAQYSKANPPPHWTKVKAIASASRGGSMNKLAEFLVRGWRDMPEDERWWDSALAGTVEQKRQARLQVVESLRSRMEETAALIII